MELSHRRALLRAALGFVLVEIPCLAWADHGGQVDLEYEALSIDWFWTMLLPIFLIVAGFVFFVVGFWLWSKRGQYPPELPPSHPRSP